MTVTELREFITTDLSDAALQVLLDAAEAEVEAYAGDAGDTVQLVDGPLARIPLTRPLESVTSVTENVSGTVTTLAGDDYRLRADGYVLERLTTGTNRRGWFRGFITVTGSPGDDSAIREAVTVDLVRLDLDEDASIASAVQSRRIGEYSETFADATKTIEEKRAEILSRLGSGTDGYIRVVGG